MANQGTIDRSFTVDQGKIDRGFADAGWELDGGFMDHLVIGHDGDLSILANPRSCSAPTSVRLGSLVLPQTRW